MPEPKRGPSDATDYSSTEAPETQAEAGEQHHPHPSDARLIPGGAHGAAVDPGMSSLERNNPPSGDESPRSQDRGSMRTDGS